MAHASYVFRWYMNRDAAALVASGAPPTRPSGTCCQGCGSNSLNCAGAAPCSQLLRHTEMLNQVKSPGVLKLPGRALRMTATWDGVVSATVELVRIRKRCRR